MRFDLADMRLFLAVLDAGSITHGARAANLSVAAASERLREMEVSGGVLLFRRLRRGVSPTQAGEALAHHARLVLRQVVAMQAELSEHARGMRATVRLLANTAAITEFLPARLGPWLAMYPKVDIDLAERPSSEIVKALAGGLADIGIVSDAVDTGALTTFPFAADHLVVAMPHGHPLSGERQLAFSQILGEAYIGFAGALQTHIDEHAARAGHRLRPRISLRTFDGICRMVASGAGIAIIPETAARRCRRTLPMAFARLSDSWARRQLLLCRRAQGDMTPVAHRLADHLLLAEPEAAKPA